MPRPVRRGSVYGGRAGGNASAPDAWSKVLARNCACGPRQAYADGQSEPDEEGLREIINNPDFETSPTQRYRRAIVARIRDLLGEKRGSNRGRGVS